MVVALREQLFVSAQEERDATTFLNAAGEPQKRHLTLVASNDDAGETETSPQVAGRGIKVPEHLTGLLMRIVQAVAEGNTVTLMKLPAELTTSVAADTLGISRPTLMKWIQEGKIPAHKVGTHTRLKTEDVHAFQAKMRQEQGRAIDELISLSNELDL